MRKYSLRNLLFLYFIFPIAKTTNGNIERIDAARTQEIQEFVNAIRKLKALQFLLGIDFEIHREYKMVAENLMRMLNNGLPIDHELTSHFPLIHQTLLERQQILENTLIHLVEECDRLIALSNKIYDGLPMELESFTPNYLMKNYEDEARFRLKNRLIPRLKSWIKVFRNTQSDPFSEDLLNPIINDLRKLLYDQIYNREKIKLENFERNKLKRWTKIGMEELREAQRRGMNLEEIRLLKNRLKAIRTVRIDFETMYLRAEMLMKMFYLAIHLCTPINELPAQQHQEEDDTLLMFQQEVHIFYERAKKNYEMAEKGRELAILMAVNLLPNEEIEKRESGKMRTWKGKIEKERQNDTNRAKKDDYMFWRKWMFDQLSGRQKKNGNELIDEMNMAMANDMDKDEEMIDGLVLDEEEQILKGEMKISGPVKTKNSEKGKEKVDMVIEQKGDESWTKDLEGTNDYNVVLKMLQDKLIEEINLPKAITENEAEIFEMDNNMERRLKFLEKEMMGNIRELIKLHYLLENRKRVTKK